MKYAILLECLTVSAVGHPWLKKNLGGKQRENESTLTNISKAPMSFWCDIAPNRDADGNASDTNIIALCFRCISNCVCVYGEAIICQAR